MPIGGMRFANKRWNLALRTCEPIDVSRSRQQGSWTRLTPVDLVNDRSRQMHTLKGFHKVRIMQSVRRRQKTPILDPTGMHIGQCVRVGISRAVTIITE
jgi:hypothetical protein